MHVSILSFLSFLGRLVSGVGSDVLVKRFQMSRFWCVVFAAAVFTAGQFCGSQIENPNYLWVVSSLTGLVSVKIVPRFPHPAYISQAYGALFGVFPALVADAFGVGGFSV